ncbi:FHA domain-containing protein [Rhizobium oryziradicis]|uniref:FHA domain-containing protein n=1 Tax=Rhizobium oryziradicis TaxID=1867956 RepID=A0A1Q8ZLC1_9HYPH|nr:FHA domain-containing protein [Rhizobium oryziradicis]OLP42541.1 hypothetical protein BJF95_23425 [Rhizobium oryziradicis]
MRLELRPKVKTDSRQSIWAIEHGRRTLGRSRECDWQIEDDTRRVSKLHCTIFRDSKGFSLSDQSANGTVVDGKTLMEGETSPLKNGSVIDIRGHAFTVTIIGEVEEDLGDPVSSLPLSDESLTISSILSDIAPNGKTARGIMGERVAEEPWAVAPTSSGKSGKTLTRNVDIGWSGPPEVKGSSTVLPDNWFEDEDYGSQLEHHNATRTVVSVAPPKRIKDVASDEAAIMEADPAPVSRSDFDEIFAEPSKPDSKRVAPSACMDARLLQTLAKTLARLDAASADCFATLGMQSDDAARLPVTDGAEIIRHLEHLVERQRRLSDALERVMREASHTLDPRIVEARVDAEQPRLPFLRGRDYWSAYRQQFEEAGQTISIKDFIRRAATGEPAIAPEPAAEPETFKGVDTKDEA